MNNNPNVPTAGEIRPEDENQLRQIRLDKLAALKAAGKDPYAVTTADNSVSSEEIRDRFDELENTDVSICGRIVTWRDMGKANFIFIQDRYGKIQSYVRVDDVGEEAYKEFKTWDIGDIVEIKGFVFRTRRGEISVHAKSVRLLSKSLLPLPEKFHGLRDTDTRYRQRYVDLIVNPEVRDTFIKRSLIIRKIREFMDSHGFLEVDTPILTPFEIGASARPFITHHNTLDMDMVLRIETELYLKRLIVGGLEKVYEVGRIFRNEGMDPKHNPEFTTIEFYQAYVDYEDLMSFIEELYAYVTREVCGSEIIPYQGKEINMTAPWTRMTMAQSVKKYAGVDYYGWRDDEDARECAKAHDVALEKENATKGEVLSYFFDAFVEDKLIQPTIIYEYPVDISPLAKRKPDEPDMTQRFEYFINGTEMGNAFSELNDPIDQRDRFERQVAEKRAAGNTTAQVDYDFVTSLEYGMPPTGGLGFGVDRLVMLLTDSASIRDVLLFPTMKPLDAPKTESKPDQSAPETPAAADAKPAEPEKIDFSNVEIEPLFADCVDFETFSKSDLRAVKVLACEAVPKSKKLLKFTLDDGTGTPRTILSGIHAFYEPEQLVGKTCIAITNLPPRAMMGIESCGMLISAVHKEGDEEKLHLLQVDPHIPAGAKLY